MSNQRFSCDRCRQHKVRCLKIGGELGGESAPGVDRGSGEQIGTCERCTKAAVPCVYSSRQKKGRYSLHRMRRDSHGIPPTRAMGFNQDFASFLSVANGPNEAFSGDIGMPILDEMGLPNFDNFYSWDTVDPSPSSISASIAESLGVCDGGISKGPDSNSVPSPSEEHSTVDSLIGQVTAVATRAARAARQLDRSVGTPLVVSSPEINEAFETANALVQIVNSIPTTVGLFSALPGTENDPQVTTGCGLIFSALSCHQHILSLFKAICASIQRSVGFKTTREGQQDRRLALHGDGASCAQFVMVLQLVMHLVNRLGRSLRIEGRGQPGGSAVEVRASEAALHGLQELTPNVEGEERNGGTSKCFVDIAQDVLRKLPEEHVKLKEAIQQLQTHMEDRLHT